MQFLEKPLTKIGKFLLNQKASQRQRNVAVSNLKQAVTIGIIFDAGNIENQKLVKNFIKSIQSQHTRITIIGYIPDSAKDYNYISDNTWHYFSKKECSLFYHPQDDFIQRFVDNKHDILLVLDINYHLPIQWISKMSLARFKAGLSAFYDEDFDFMIALKEKSMPELIEQLHKYLSELHGPQNN